MNYSFVMGEEGNHEESISKITFLEDKYSIKFPGELSEYYKKYDGEKIKLSIITIDGYECEISKIIPIIGEKTSFEIITDRFKKDGFMPMTCYPLARDRGGDYYCWDSETHKVSLFLVDDIDNPFVVAKNIEDFFKLLNGEE